MAFLILFILYTLLWLAVLELNKNMIIGWIIALVLLGGYILLRRKLLSFRLFTRLGAFLLLTVLLVLNFFITQGPVKRRPAVEGKNPTETEIIHLSQGKLSGVVTEDGQVEVYTGIPYAAPPVGQFRWKEPQDAPAWEGVFKADTFGPLAMQTVDSNLWSSIKRIVGFHDYQISLHDNFRDAVSEDSLYLNIWKPAGEQKNLPVIVYVHGGSLQTGQPWYRDYSGQGLARKGVIVVNFAYRLGVFGFYADEELVAESPNGTTGNYGFLDQVKALEWVHENIAAFGGDPSNVTIAGESAGSACVSALCTSPLTEGLFVRVIGESSTVTAPVPAHSFRSLDDAFAAGKRTRERFGAGSLKEMRTLSAEELVSALDINHHLTVDGYALEKTPFESYLAGENHEQAQLQGCNSEEGTPFILFDMANLSNYEEKVRFMFGEYADEVLAMFPASTNQEARQNWIDIYSAWFFSYGHHCWSRQAVANGVPAYEYYFSRTNGYLGPWHSGEEIYCWGNIPENSKLFDSYDRELSDIFCSYFANFARTGNPNGEGLPEWEPSSNGRQVLELGDRVQMREKHFLPLYDLMDRMQNFNA